MLAAFKSILVALDGDQGGLDAAVLAALLATPDGELTLAHVLTGAARGRSTDEVRRAAVEVMRRHRRGPVAAAPPLVTTRAGSVVASLRELVEARSIELLVVGHHHHR